MILPIHAITAATQAGDDEHHQRYVELRQMGLNDAAARAALEEFLTYWRARPWPSDVAWRCWKDERRLSTYATLTADHSNLTAAMRSLEEAFLLFVVALARKPCGAKVCSCHPDPFPAARDYRRRTKHRRRHQR